MQEILVSVVIPTYNGGHSIGRAVLSVQSQSYKNVEIIIINDASQDGTLQVLQELQKKDARISVIENTANEGFVKSLNKGIAKAHGSYIARLDDDDEWVDAQKLEKQIGFLEKNPEYVLVGGGLIKINSGGQETTRYLFAQHDADIRKSILVESLFAHSSVVFRKDAFQKVGGYDRRFGFFADQDLWLKLGTVGKFYNFPGYFIQYLDKEDGAAHYAGRNNDIRRKLKLNIIMRSSHKNRYPGFYQSIMLYIASYVYSYLPWRQKFRRLMFGMRVLAIGQPSYTQAKPPHKKP